MGRLHRPPLSTHTSIRILTWQCVSRSLGSLFWAHHKGRDIIFTKEDDVSGLKERVGQQKEDAGQPEDLVSEWLSLFRNLNKKYILFSGICSVKVKVTQSPTLCNHNPWNSPGQNTGVGSLPLLQGIFPTQGLNPGLPHCRQILYQLNHKGSPYVQIKSNWSKQNYFLKLTWII